MALVEIKIGFKSFLTAGLIFFSTLLFSQTSSLNTDTYKPDPSKEKMFFPYLAVRHGGPAATEAWKQSNTVQYYKELWYFCESFYVRRNYVSTGEHLNESIIDITRFESSRKQNEESIVVLPGFRDALVLKPTNQLVYKPAY